MSFSSVLQSPSAQHWQKAGTAKRAGVLAPLFSIYSKDSMGIGEIPDLTLLADWCEKTGISIIQILPLNDTGWDFRPYDSQSGFAIDPVYLRLEKLQDSAVDFFASKIAELKEEFSNPGRFVNYSVKFEKLELLWQIFHHPRTNKENPTFLNFIESEKKWLEPYAAFKVLKKIYNNQPWWQWPEPLRAYDPQIIEQTLVNLKSTLLFHQWLAWQTTEQLQKTAARIRARNILILADMPFLVSRDSADVWMNPRFFKLDREAGAPPDLYIAEGQRWGMPPYCWEAIEADGFSYLKERIRFLSRYAHLYRIDHFVGLCRIWSIASSEPRESAGRNGTFDPENPTLWKAQGEKIVKAMLEASDMLPCAEDLGVVPDCAYEILNEYQVPGSDVQRWMRHWKGDGSFQAPEDYRFLSASNLSTHDMPSLPLWWKTEASAEEKEKMAKWVNVSLQDAEADFTFFSEKVLERVLQTHSVFSVHALQDWLALSGHEEFFKIDHKINEPGKVLAHNWSIRIPYALEEMLGLNINAKILQLVESSSRKV